MIILGLSHVGGQSLILTDLRLFDGLLCPAKYVWEMAMGTLVDAQARLLIPLEAPSPYIAVSVQ